MSPVVVAEEDRCRFRGVDIEKENYGEEINMNSFIKSFLVMLTVMLGFGVLPAQANDPSFKIGTASLISPTAAQTYYDNATVPTGVDIWGGLSRTEISELANALHYDIDLIFEYVRNNVEVTPLYGLKKGAMGALLEHHGTPFDQAHLLVELLKHSDAVQATGYSPKYRLGTISITLKQAAEWFGVAYSTGVATAGVEETAFDTASLQKVLADGGIPASISGENITISHIWVEATVGGQAYLFDPAFKPYEYKKGILDLKDISAINFNLTTFKNNAESGMTSLSASGIDYIQAVNSGNIETYLTTRATTLLNTLKTSYAKASLEDIIGYRKIIPIERPEAGFRDTILSDHVDGGTGYVDIPNQYRTTMQIKFSDYFTEGGSPQYLEVVNKTLFVDDIYGGFTGFKTSANLNNFSLSFVAGGALISLYNNAGFDHHPLERTNAKLVINVNHPYAANNTYGGVADGSYMDRDSEFKVDYVSNITIVNGWGFIGSGFEDRVNKSSYDGKSLITQIYTHWDDGFPEPDQIEPTFKADLIKTQVAAGWLKQMSSMADIQSALGSGIFQHHHSFGVSYNSTYVSKTTFECISQTCMQRGAGEVTKIGDETLRLSIISGASVNHKEDDDVKRKGMIQSIVSSAATLEGSIYEQLNDATEIASTASRFDWANTYRAGETDVNKGQLRFYFFPADIQPSYLDTYVATKKHLLLNYFDGAFTDSGKLFALVSQYVSEGYDVTVSEFDALGPGSYSGIRVIISGMIYTYPTKGMRRGIAMVAVKPDTGEIAHIVTDSQRSFKGSGSSASPEEVAEFDPMKSADILKDNFEDRSNLHGVSLSDGKLTYSPSTDLTLGSGEMPYALSFQRNFQSGKGRSPGFPDGWTHNWDIVAQTGGSGMEAMGQSSVRNAVASLAAFQVLQELYAATPVDISELKKQVYAVFVNNWWGKHLSNNTVTVRHGSGSQSFFRMVDGSFNAPGNGTAVLTQTGSRFLADVPGSPAVFKEWRYENMSFSLKQAGKDVISFSPRLMERDRYYGGGIQSTTKIKTGYFPAASWSFPSGMSINFSYAVNNSPILLSVANNLGRQLDFTWGSHDGVSVITDINATDRYKIQFTYDREGYVPVYTYHLGDRKSRRGLVLKSSTDALDNVIDYTYHQATFMFLDDVFNPSDVAAASTIPSLRFSYDVLKKVYEVHDAVALKGGVRGTYKHYYANGRRGEREDPLGNSYSVYYNDKGQPIRHIDEIGRVVTTDYYNIGWVKSRTYPEGNQAVFEYDNLGNVDKMTQVAKPTSGLPDLMAEAAYDPVWNKPLWVRDAMGNQTDLEYYPLGVSGAGQIKKATRPEPTTGATRPVYSYEYNSYGQLNKVTDPLNMVTLNSYDASGNLATTTVDNGGIALKTVYYSDFIGNVCRTVDPRGSDGLVGGYDPACDPPPVNNPPVAVNDSKTASTGTEATISVLVNDYDPDGDPLTVISISDTTNCSKTSSTVTCEFFTQGSHGISYTISDGNGGTDSAIAEFIMEGPPV